jgi:beta-N-acetylhexosaminidase
MRAWRPQVEFAVIEDNDLQPFAMLGNELDAVMMAHVLYPQADSKPAGYSEFWIQAVLRQQLGFSGTVFSDDLGMFAAKVAGGLAARVRVSLQAGCDAVLVCNPADVRGLMEAGDLPATGANQALTRLKGRFTANRDDVETVKEWRQWKTTIEQLEQTRWS